jgi:hypothetical protein
VCSPRAGARRARPRRRMRERDFTGSSCRERRARREPDHGTEEEVIARLGSEEGDEIVELERLGGERGERVGRLAPSARRAPVLESGSRPRGGR